MDHTMDLELHSPGSQQEQRRPEGKPFGKLIIRLALVLLGGSGAALGVYLCLLIALASSTPINGRIMAIKVPPPTGAAGTPLNSDFPRTGLYKLPPPAPRLEYSFRVGERTIQDAMPLTAVQVQRMPQTDRIQVRTISAFVDRWHAPILPNDSLWRSVGLLTLLTIAVNGLFIALIRSVFARS